VGTDFSSADASALQLAVDAADSSDPNTVVKLAGTCMGVQTVGGNTQMARIAKSLTLQGGYDPNAPDWQGTPDPNTFVTVLDANDAGRVLYNHGPEQRHDQRHGQRADADARQVPSMPAATRAAASMTRPPAP